MSKLFWGSVFIGSAITIFVTVMIIIGINTDPDCQDPFWANKSKCANTVAPSGSSCETINVKYRSPQKLTLCSDVFSQLPNSSGTVREAFYDSLRSYMIVNLNGTNYHYCRFPSDAWRKWSSTLNKYAFYERDIRGNYDCRLNSGGDVPEYSGSGRRL